MSNTPSPEPLDLLYILGTGSTWQDNEIRYSLRSVCKNFTHGKVFVVGERPPWLRDIIHIPCDDPYPNKLKNGIYKIGMAIKDSRLSSRFVRMNDDFFFINPVKQIAIRHRGALKASIKNHPTQKGYFYLALKQALHGLERRGITNPLDYTSHLPFVLDKAKVREVFDEYGGPGYGYLFGTIYGNHFDIGGRKQKDRKAKGWSPSSERTANALPILSTDPNVVMLPEFQRWLHGKFPEKCRYEK